MKGQDCDKRIVHILTGAIAYWTSRKSQRASQLFFQIFGIVYGVVALLGFGAGDSPVLGFILERRKIRSLRAVMKGSLI